MVQVGGGAHATACGSWRWSSVLPSARRSQTYVIQQGDATTAIYQATFGTEYGATAVLSYAGPLILTALAFAVAYRMRLWNLGGEGQLFMGA